MLWGYLLTTEGASGHTKCFSSNSQKMTQPKHTVNLEKLATEKKTTKVATAVAYICLLQHPMQRYKKPGSIFPCSNKSVLIQFANLRQ